SDNLGRMLKFLAEHHKPEFQAMMRDYLAHNDEFSSMECERIHGYSPFLEAVLSCYESVFDPSALDDEKALLEAEHTAMMEQWKDLPTPLAKEKAKARFEQLEARMAELDQQRQDLAEVVERQYHEMMDLQRGLEEAKDAMMSEGGEHALRHRAK